MTSFEAAKAVDIFPEGSVVSALWTAMTEGQADNPLGIDFATLLAAAYSVTGRVPLSEPQEYLGCSFSYINRRLARAGQPFRVKPGDLKGTYTLRLA